MHIVVHSEWIYVEAVRANIFTSLCAVGVVYYICFAAIFFVGEYEIVSGFTQCTQWNSSHLNDSNNFLEREYGVL